MPQQASSSSSSSSIRPWRVFFDLHSFSLPYSYHEATSRIRLNTYHFRYNYALIALLIVLCSLVYHPTSIIVFLLIFLLWMYFYFFRNDPIVVLGKTVDDRLVLVGLSVVTVVALVLTRVGSNVLVALCVAVAVVGLHGVFRGTEDLFLDENEAAEGGLISVVR